MTRSPQRVWLLLAVVSSVLMAAAFVAVVITPVPLVPNLYILGLVAFPVVGGLVVARQPDNLVGRLMTGTGAWDSLGLVGNTYLWISLETQLHPLGLAAWLATWAYWPGAALMVWIVAVFPSGRLTSPRLRLPLRIGTAALIILTVVLMFVPAPVNTVYFSDDVTNPLGVEALSSFVFVSDILPFVVTALLATVVTDLILRWRRSHGVERIQMRWVGLGLLVVILLSLIGFLTDVLGLTNQLVWVAVWLGFGALPAAVGVAVTRYRLYDIDRLVSRTVTYAIVAGLLAGVFAAIAIALPRVASVPDENPLLVAGATLAVAALFSPLRRRVQAKVDRRFNRIQYDARREVDRLADHLRNDVKLEDVTDGVLGVVASTMEPASVSVWIRGEE